MAFKLTKAESAEREQVLQQLNDAWTAYEDELSKAKEAIQAVYDSLNAKLGDYRTAIEEATRVSEEIGNRLREEWDGKSEKWQESDAGTSANEMVEQWENAQFDEVEDLTPPDIEDVNSDHCETFEGLPTEVE